MRLLRIGAERELLVALEEHTCEVSLEVLRVAQLAAHHLLTICLITSDVRHLRRLTLSPHGMGGRLDRRLGGPELQELVIADAKH